eukprot:4821823-Karenia_brevis.AAC.1
MSAMSHRTYQANSVNTPVTVSLALITYTVGDSCIVPHQAMLLTRHDHMVDQLHVLKSPDTA